MWDSSEIWYSIFKLASIIFGGIVAALGEFFEYRKNGRITKTGKVALLLFTLSVISAVVFSLLEDKKSKANDAIQEAHYKNNIDTLKLVAQKLNAIEKQYKANSDTEAQRHTENLNKLLVVNSSLKNIISNLKAENNSSYQRHLQSLDSLSKVTQELLLLNDKTIAITASTEKLNNSSKETLRNLERTYFPIEPLNISFESALTLVEIDSTKFHKKSRSFYRSDLNSYDTVEFNQYFVQPHGLIKEKITSKGVNELEKLRINFFHSYIPNKSPLLPLVADQRFSSN